MLRKHLAIITFTLAGLLPLQAEEKAADHPLKPLLWKVEGGELKEPSWLFGTIHLGREPAAKLHPLAAKAMEASDVFYTEIDMDPRKQLALAMKFMRKDGKKLTESIGEELTKQLDAELKAINPQLNSKAFDPMKTWAVYVTLPLLKEQIAGLVALDQRLWNQAKEAGKDLDAIETADSQIQVFENFNEEEQIVMLAETIKLQRENRLVGKDPYDDLLAAYVSGDPEIMENAMNAEMQKMMEGEHKELGLRFKKLLLDDRNTSMTETIHQKLKAQPGRTHFFAVGVGHLVGKGSICEQLRDKGYTVTLHQD